MSLINEVLDSSKDVDAEMLEVLFGRNGGYKLEGRVVDTTSLDAEELLIGKLVVSELIFLRVDVTVIVDKSSEVLSPLLEL